MTLTSKYLLKPKDSTKKFEIFHEAMERAKRGEFSAPEPTHPERSRVMDDIRLNREQMRRDFRSSLFLHCKYALGFADLDEEVHGPMCESFQNAYWGIDAPKPHLSRKLLSLYPRGSLKTTILTIGFPTWVFYQDDPPEFDAHPSGKEPWRAPPSFNGKKGYNQRIMLSHETERFSKMYLRQIREILESNEILRELYGDLFFEKRTDGLWGSTELNVRWRDDFTAKEPNLFINSMDKAINSGHCDIGSFDDMISEKKVSNYDQMEKSREFYRNMQPVLDPTSLQFWVGTRWDDGDLYGTYIEEGDWEIHIDRAERSDEEVAAGARRYFWPSRMGKEFLDAMRIKLGPYKFSCLYQNDPIDQSSAIFKKIYFEPSTQVYKLPMGENLREFLADKQVFTTGDPAYSQEKKGKVCRATITTCAWDYQQSCWLLRAFGKKNCHPNEYLEEFFLHFTMFGAVQCGIEKGAYEAVFKPNIEAKSYAEEVYLPWVDLNTGGRSKEFRINRLEPLFANSKFHYQAEHGELVEEALRYPRGKYKDYLDSLAYQLDVAFIVPSPGGPDEEEDLGVDDLEHSVSEYEQMMEERRERLLQGSSDKMEDWYNG